MFGRTYLQERFLCDWSATVEHLSGSVSEAKGFQKSSLLLCWRNKVRCTILPPPQDQMLSWTSSRNNSDPEGPAHLHPTTMWYRDLYQLDVRLCSAAKKSFETLHHQIKFNTHRRLQAAELQRAFPEWISSFGCLCRATGTKWNKQAARRLNWIGLLPSVLSRSSLLLDFLGNVLSPQQDRKVPLTSFVYWIPCLSHFT